MQERFEKKGKKRGNDGKKKKFRYLFDIMRRSLRSERRDKKKQRRTKGHRRKLPGKTEGLQKKGRQRTTGSTCSWKGETKETSKATRKKKRGSASFPERLHGRAEGFCSRKESKRHGD